MNKSKRDLGPDLPMSTKEKWIRALLILVLVPPMIYFLMSINVYADSGTPSYPGANNEGGFNYGKGPNHNDDGIPLFGGCNKKGDLCWGININPPQSHLPIEVYGGQARNLIAKGQITHANMDRHGVFYLNVWSRYYDSSFDCDVNVSRRRYHCVENW